MANTPEADRADIGRRLNTIRVNAYCHAVYFIGADNSAAQVCGYKTREEAVYKIIEKAKRDCEKLMRDWERANPLD